MHVTVSMVFPGACFAGFPPFLGESIICMFQSLSALSWTLKASFRAEPWQSASFTLWLCREIHAAGCTFTGQQSHLKLTRPSKVTNEAQSGSWMNCHVKLDLTVLLQACCLAVADLQGLHVCCSAGTKLHPNREAPRCLPCNYKDPLLDTGGCPGHSGWIAPKASSSSTAPVVRYEDLQCSCPLTVYKLLQKVGKKMNVSLKAVDGSSFEMISAAV